MEFTGKTVEEAIASGLESLNLSREEAEIKVISEEVKGLFGKVKSPAVVEVSKIKTGGEKAVDFLEGIFEKMGVTAKSTLVSEGENIVINIVTTSSASIIGYRGEVLDALQSLAGAVANIGNKNYIRVVVDCENYREKREETLKNLAKRLAEKAVKQGRDVALEPMNPYERRVIHSTLAENEEVTTTSEGKEPNRHVVIVPNVKKEYKKPYNKDKKFNGRNNNKQRSSGEIKKKSPSMFGTFLGNSLKD